MQTYIPHGNFLTFSLTQNTILNITVLSRFSTYSQFECFKLVLRIQHA